MTKFRLKISSDNIEVYQDKEKIGEGDDYKEVLAFIAYTIDDEDIDKYEIWLHEKGTSNKLDDFDHETILKYSKKLKFDSDNDDNEDDNSDRNRRLSNSNSESPSKPRYVRKYKSSDYQNIGLAWRDSLNNSMGKE